MVAVEIRFDGESVLVRRFGSWEFKRWEEVRQGDEDRTLTGWTYEELRRLGEGLWGFPEPDDQSYTVPALAGS
jgi:hypothetical protein